MDEQSLSALADSCCEDQQRRWDAGERVPVEHYLALYPELAAAEGPLLDLVLNEWGIRSDRGETPDLAEYCRRFPQIAEPLRAHREMMTAPPAPLPSRGWPKIPGYKILEKLDEGGMGVVYLARDMQRDQVVALKTLRRMEPTALDRFQQEFRRTVDLTHPNLVTLYDLIFDGEQWCYTMEFVPGVDFVRYVRSPDGNSFSETRLREALLQLVKGVEALHKANLLHRDIKPRNVLVTPEGRVVVLDFGLVAELGPEGMHQPAPGHVSGTLCYMSPEQASSRPVSAASDWYSVGVMLYEALTGEPALDARLRRADDEELPGPGTRVPGVPADLNELCGQLLRFDPQTRPLAAEIFAQLSSRPAGPVFVGRAAELAALRDAYARVGGDQAAVVFVRGETGIGKSDLLNRFLSELPSDAVVLRGRCHERERIPVNAFDGVVGALSWYLRQLDAAEMRELMPRNVQALACVFPLLLQVPELKREARRARLVPDRQELRRIAFIALRELLARLGDRRRLVLAIDDLQWGDADSGALLAELLRAPDPPTFLLLGCYRTKDAAQSPLLHKLEELQDPSAAAVKPRHLTLEPLSLAEARQLALSLLRDQGPGRAEQAEKIARESEGNPFYVYELVDYLQTGEELPGGELLPPDLKLDEVLWIKVSRLPAAFRHLLELLAVAGQPLREDVAFAAAGHPAPGRSMLNVLRRQRLICTTRAGEEEEVEIYHYRLRTAILQRLPPDLVKTYHAWIADALERSGRADAVSLAAHFEGAGNRPRAADYYGQAADEATANVAFDRAADLYRLALRLQPEQGNPPPGLLRKLADALANAGRGEEAAKAYDRAATHAAGQEALELRHRAAAQLLTSGHIDEGLRELQVILNGVGLGMPRLRYGLLLELLLRRYQWRRRRLPSRPPDTPPSSDTAFRLDLCWTMTTGLALVDPMCAMLYNLRGLLRAVQAGDAHQLVRALAFHAAGEAATGLAQEQRSQQYLQAARDLAEPQKTPYDLGILALSEGLCAFAQGRWKNAQRHCEQAADIFSNECTGKTWELDTAHGVTLWSLMYMGEIQEVHARRTSLLREAQVRGDVFAETNFGTYLMAMIRLALDDAEGARQELKRAMDKWTPSGFHVQHHNALVARVMIDLYQGEAQAAWQHVGETWTSYTRAFLFRLQHARVDMLLLRARVALAVARRDPQPKRFLRRATRDARRLAAEGTPWSEAMATFVRALVAVQNKPRAGAMALLREAATALASVDMLTYAAVARHRLGELVGGEEGRTLIADAAAWLAKQKVVNPQRLIAMLAPAPGD